jgi:hypothetical protein
VIAAMCGVVFSDGNHEHVVPAPVAAADYSVPATTNYGEAVVPATKTFSSSGYAEVPSTFFHSVKPSYAQGMCRTI